MLEAWLLAVAAASGTVTADAPSAELLEFIADWTPAEQRLIEEAARQQKVAAKPERKTDGGTEHEKSKDEPR